MTLLVCYILLCCVCVCVCVCVCLCVCVSVCVCSWTRVWVCPQYRVLLCSRAGEAILCCQTDNCNDTPESVLKTTGRGTRAAGGVLLLVGALLLHWL